MSDAKSVYQGRWYEPDTVIEQTGVRMVADASGFWRELDGPSEEEQPGDRGGICYYAGYSYQEGSLTCQDGEQMRCNNQGVWNPTGSSCRCETSQPPGPEKGGVCAYQSGTYSEGSIACQGGQRMRCTNHGVWSPMNAECKC
jgi:hypothetical protein